MHVKELESEHHRGGQEEDQPTALEPPLQEVEGPRGETDGGDLLHMTGVNK